MKLNILILSFIAIMSFMFEAAAQTNLVSFPTPEAAELGKYGQIPVSYFNGLPEISIPLYTVQCKDIQVPISLSYHAGGNKPDEHPCWVGLGWNLNAGGMITRIIHCQRDELDKDDLFQEEGIPYKISCNTGYYYRSNDMNSSYSSILTNSLGNDYCYNFLDTEPDEFIFNFNGHSGSFYFVNIDGQTKTKIKNKSGDILKIEPILSQDKLSFLSFEYCSNAIPIRFFANKTFLKFVVTTTDGVKYEFGGSTDNIDFTTSNCERTVASSWHLSKITSPNGNFIVFNYVSGGTPFVQNKSAHVYQSFNSTTGYYLSDNSNFSKSDHSLDGISVMLIHPKYLKEIKTSTGQVINFISSKTTELDYDNWDVLDTDFWEHHDNSEDVRYIHEYPNALKDLFTNSGWEKGRLNDNYYKQLDRIEVIGIKNINLFYTKSLLERLKLSGLSASPSNTSAPTSLESVDNIYKYRFGYNPTILPKYNSLQTDNWGFYNNIDYSAIKPVLYSTLYETRKPDINYAVAEILETITYPTKGTSNFKYESNNFSKIVSGAESDLPPFTLYSSLGETGGLRIQKITNYPNINDQTIKTEKKFFYENTDGLSSGILSGKPTYIVNGKLSNGNGVVEYNMYSQSNLIPLSNTNGNHVTYSRVKEVESDGSYSIYSYTNHEEFRDEVPVDIATNMNGKTLVNAFTSKELERGLLKSKSVYNTSKALVQKTTYTYNNSIDRYLDYLKSINKYIVYTFSGKYLVDFCGVAQQDMIPFFKYSGTKIYTFNPYLKSKTDSIYDLNGANLITSTSKFTYNQNRLPQTTITVNSKNDSIKNSIIYSGDINNSGTVYAKMQNKFMIDYPVEKTSSLNNRIVGSEITTYKEVPIIGDALYLPDKMYKLELTSPLSAFNAYDGNQMDSHYGVLPNIEFYKYDAKGNLIEAKNRQGESTSYLWSYNYQYPIAQIKNATYEGVKIALGIDPEVLATSVTPDMSNVSNLSLALPNAQVSTFSYKPMVGITSMTDPRGLTTRYIYDNFNRLSMLRDNNMSVIKMYNYGYKNEGGAGVGAYNALAAVFTPNLTATSNASNIAFVSVTGGSSNFVYSWTLKNSASEIIASNENTTSSQYAYVCPSTGTYTLQCKVTDLVNMNTTVCSNIFTFNYTPLRLVVTLDKPAYYERQPDEVVTIKFTPKATGGSGNYIFTYAVYDYSGRYISGSTGNDFTLISSEDTSYTIVTFVTDATTGVNENVNTNITIVPF